MCPPSLCHQVKTWFQNRRMKHKKLQRKSQDGDEDGDVKDTSHDSDDDMDGPLDDSRDGDDVMSNDGHRMMSPGEHHLPHEHQSKGMMSPCPDDEEIDVVSDNDDVSGGGLAPDRP